MHPDRVWIVLVILAAVLIGANLLMLGLVRGIRGHKGDIFKNFRDAARPWKEEDQGLRELNRRVRELQKLPKEEDKP